MKNFSKKELNWIKKLQKTLDCQPLTLQVFDNESSIAIFKSDDLPIKDNLAVDSSFEYKRHVKPKRGHWEAGAW